MDGQAESGAHSIDGVRYRAGDVLRMGCPFTGVTVTEAARSHVSVRWPWWEIDEAADGIEWNGDVALPTSADHDWGSEYFRTQPVEDTLKAGDRCLVGIPPTVVHVLAVRHFDPPLETGWLPRPATHLDVLRQGESHDTGLEGAGECCPVRIVRLGRSSTAGGRVGRGGRSSPCRATSSSPVTGHGS